VALMSESIQSTYRQLNNKFTIGGIFCDLEIALNFVDQNKLQYYGITASLCTLIQSYLTGRYQHVVINSKISTHNIYSKWCVNSKSVLQGSILGHLLFLIYINDLPITSNTNDTSVLITTSNLIDLGKKTFETLKQLLKLLNSNLLSLNLLNFLILKP
jgi:hypothetical protein